MLNQAIGYTCPFSWYRDILVYKSMINTNPTTTKIDKMNVPCKLLTKKKNFRINLVGHRPRVRRYAQHGLGKLVKIGKGEASYSGTYTYQKKENL